MRPLSPATVSVGGVQWAMLAVVVVLSIALPMLALFAGASAR